MRYPPNTQKREHIRYHMADTCPFRQEKFGDVVYLIKPRKEMPKHNILRSLIYEDKVKEITHRLTEPVACTTRKAHFAHLPLNDQDDNRLRLFKMYGDELKIRTIPGMYTNLGSLRYQGRSGQIYGQPITPAAHSNEPLYIGKSSGGPKTKSLGIETYNIATPRCAKWRTIQGVRASNKRNEDRIFKTRRPESLSRYSIHDPPRLESSRVKKSDV